jgi:hypothetical protein
MALFRLTGELICNPSNSTGTDALARLAQPLSSSPSQSPQTAEHSAAAERGQS